MVTNFFWRVYMLHRSLAVSKSGPETTFFEQTSVLYDKQYYLLNLTRPTESCILRTMSIITNTEYTWIISKQGILATGKNKNKRDCTCTCLPDLSVEYQKQIFQYMKTNFVFNISPLQALPNKTCCMYVRHCDCNQAALPSTLIDRGKRPTTTNL